jgi:hypothetical protein
MLFGHWQENEAIGSARGALAALAELLPDETERVGPDGELRTVSLDELGVGDVVLVRAGARVPADDVVIYSDDGGKVIAARPPICGRQRVAWFWPRSPHGAGEPATRNRFAEVNGHPTSSSWRTGARSPCSCSTSPKTSSRPSASSGTQTQLRDLRRHRRH